MTWTAACALALLFAGPACAFETVGDAIPAPLAPRPGDPVPGRAIVVARQVGLCVLCHSGPFPEERFQGNLAPDLTGVGARLTVGQLRLRIASARTLNPETIMPIYAGADGLSRVAVSYSGKPLLDGAQIEDVVAFLSTLKEPTR